MEHKRTILVTGCSDCSLGSSLALALQKNGWRVFASARNPERLKQVEAAGIETVQLDVTDDESITAAVSRIKELTGGSLDALVNNAGAGYTMPLMDVNISRARRLYDLNVFSLISVTRAFLPLLLKSPCGSIIVNNTSVVAIPAGSLPLQVAYNSSKAAAANISDGMRIELRPFGIRVINLMTGAVKSSFFENGPRVTLPSDSLYCLATDVIEEAAAGTRMKAGSPDTAKWADKVAKDLSKNRPSHWIWRGRYGSLMRIARLLPLGWTDGALKNKAGLDVIERRIKEMGVVNECKVP